ncbi:MAG TPA: PQQ-binding-like beta-propeller repeat protein, partial [Novosphingobium sp.]|nr:PQQ-binding-like beta-propeller repeat protein [Novosphingobium sp.]
EPILSRVESAALADPELSMVSVVLPSQTENADWSQPGGSASKSYGNLALADKPARQWSAPIAGANERRRLAAAPVVGGGLLFAYDTLGVLHAFDVASGKEAWTASFAVAGTTEDAVFGGGASYDDGKVFVTTGIGEVAALDAKTGKQLWKVKPAGPLRGAPTVAFGAAFVMTQNNEIHALNITDGTTLWQESASLGSTGVFGVAAPAAGQGTVVAGFSTGELIAFRYENGRSLWNDALARTSLSTSVGVLTDIDADPIIDRGRVYALGQGGRMAAYELVSGQRIWELNLAGISTPAIGGEWIFTLTDEGKLLCIARSTGKVRWVSQLARFKKPNKKEGPIYWTGPVLAGDKLWLTNSEGDVYSVSAADGSATRFTSLRAPISLAPIVAGGRMYVLDDSGTITAFK